MKITGKAVETSLSVHGRSSRLNIVFLVICFLQALNPCSLSLFTCLCLWSLFLSFHLFSLFIPGSPISPFLFPTFSSPLTPIVIPLMCPQVNQTPCNMKWNAISLFKHRRAFMQYLLERTADLTIWGLKSSPWYSGAASLSSRWPTSHTLFWDCENTAEKYEWKTVERYELYKRCEWLVGVSETESEKSDSRKLIKMN